MANQYTKTFPISKWELENDYIDKNMSQTEIAEKYDICLKVVQRLMRDYGIKPRKAIKRNQIGKNNSSWKGGVIKDRGYILTKAPNHPRASMCGEYVYEHILVMEQHIGRLLKWHGFNNPNSEVVHHINGIKHDNRIENLLLTTIGEHAKIHKNYLLATKARWCKCQRQS